MRQTIPLIITALGGFVLIVAMFSPYTESWGEVAAIWFDILAAIAFLLGGGNLLKVHLQKVTARRAGWGYSAITLVAFLVTLYVGLVKWGSTPAPRQEFFGQVFAPLPQSAFPMAYSVAARVPEVTANVLPASLRDLITFDRRAEKLTFHGWMTAKQQRELLACKDRLAWQCAVEKLFARAQPPAIVRGKVFYYPERGVLAYQGHMTAAARDALLELGTETPWRQAVRQLHATTQRVVHLRVDPQILPARFDPKPFGTQLRWEADTLAFQGPMTVAQRDLLARGFLPLTRPCCPADRKRILNELRGRGPLTDPQIRAVDRVLGATWTTGQLHRLLDQAGQTTARQPSACALLAQRASKRASITGHPGPPHGREESRQPPATADKRTRHILSAPQVERLEKFAHDSTWTVPHLLRELEAAGPLTATQRSALASFFDQCPTVAQQRKELGIALLHAGPLTRHQRDFLFRDCHAEYQWQTVVGRLFTRSQQVKYPWSGGYRAEGTPFWWLYEYAFKPLTATMFAMLAFYVASAAFRAFRAKNLEAILLLGTAFVILLGQTFAGVVATEWLPDWLSGLKTNNLSFIIMSVFNTAGNRAIMIGIALGIASTSLKVLLGIDRSYLGSGEN